MPAAEAAGSCDRPLGRAWSFLPRVRTLLGWQLCSLLLTATGYCSQRLANMGINVPTAQVSLVYLLLSLHAIPLMLRRTQLHTNKLSPLWWLLIAAADLEGNFLLVLSYQYTDIISVCLLDAFTVPTVMMLSAFAFGQRYSHRQLAAAALCLLQLIFLRIW